MIRAIVREDSGVYACRIDTGSQDSVIQRFKLKVEGMWYYTIIVFCRGQ